MEELTQKQWEKLIKDNDKSYQEDLFKYTKEISILKKTVKDKDREVSKLKRNEGKFNGICYIGTCKRCKDDKAIFEVGNIKECLACYMGETQRIIDALKARKPKKIRTSHKTRGKNNE